MRKIFWMVLRYGTAVEINCGQIEIQLCVFKTPVGKSDDHITICNSLDIEKRND